MSKTDRQVADDLTERWSAADHECPFNIHTQKRLCRRYENVQNKCKKCIRNEAFKGIK